MYANCILMYSCFSMNEFKEEDEQDREVVDNLLQVYDGVRWRSASCFRHFLKKVLKIVRIDDKSPVHAMQLGNIPWKVFLRNDYPFIDEVCKDRNMDDAKTIAIVRKGGKKTVALFFEDAHTVPFSYEKIGMSQKNALKKRLHSAFHNEKLAIHKALGGPGPCRYTGFDDTIFLYEKPQTYTKLTKMFGRVHVKLAEQLEFDEDIGWRLPLRLRGDFFDFHSAEAKMYSVSKTYLNRS